MGADRSMAVPKSPSSSMTSHKAPPSSCFSDSKFFPPGFRFHPTDEELILYYLKRKICRRRLKLDIIAETDVYKWDPEELPEISKLKTGDRQWFFFSPRDRKYPNGGRSNRATMHGYWKATGKDRAIICNSRTVGLKKTLVYYKGRAPAGERTDWVMHEYILDEEELKRCTSVQDYYALYKVYKKSGPGPKNGEQYGAPFKEEDWIDDDCVSFSGLMDQQNSVKEVTPVDNNRCSGGMQQDPVDDLNEFMKKIVDDPVLVPPLAVDYSYRLDQSQTIGEKENDRTLLNHCSFEGSVPNQIMVPQPSQHPNVQGQGSFEYSPSAASQLQTEASDVTSVQNMYQQGLGEFLFEDFLEMDDLLGPDPTTVQNIEKPPEEVAFDGIEGLTEADMDQFFHDVRQADAGQNLQPYVSNYSEIGRLNVSSHPYLDDAVNGTLSYQVQPLSTDANLMWTYDQTGSIFTPEANQAAVSQSTSGVVCNVDSASLPTGARQNQIASEDDGTDSWFSSALWSFVESIPTTPASASENALVSKAFERMSSFSRLTMNTGETKAAAGNPAAATTTWRLRSSLGGICSFSILGIFCAILWVLIATSVKLLSRYIFS